MNTNKITQKSIEVINQCESIAYQYGNQEINQEHLLYSLITVSDSLIAKLIEKMDIDFEHFKRNVESHLDKLVKVQGGDLRSSSELAKALNFSERSEERRVGKECYS